MEINATITKRINEQVGTLGLPQTALSRNTGIAYATLNRKMHGTSEWTVAEVLRVAVALRVSAAELVPELFDDAMAGAV